MLNGFFFVMFFIANMYFRISIHWISLIETKRYIDTDNHILQIADFSIP